MLIKVIRVVEFTSKGYKMGKIFALKSTYLKKIIEFGELVKFGQKSIFYVKNLWSLSQFFFIEAHFCY